MLLPLVREQRDPIGSMGNDSALAVLSDKPRMLYDYFKQLFAQVTNPPIDSIREEVIMSLECYIGPERESARNDRGARPSAAHSASDSDERGAGRAQAHESSRLEVARRSTSRSPRSEGEAGLIEGARPHLRRGRAGDRRRLFARRPVRPRDRPRPRAAQLAAGDAAPCIIIWCARRSARRSASLSKRAKPAKCITIACLSATAPMRSIRTWRSKSLWQGRSAETALLAEAPHVIDRRRTDRRTPIARASPRACSK